MKKPIVLLTATIQCVNVPLVQRQDPKLREADYLWAIKGWLEVDGYDTLVFCENSGAALQRLEAYAREINLYNHKLIFLSCGKNEGSRERGKGYGEMEIIRHALDSIPGLEPEQLLVKVTGRYRARNAKPLLEKLYSHQANILCLLRGKLTHADSRLFAITVKCAREHLLSRQSAINDAEGRYFEHALASAVHSTLLSGGTWSPLPCDPLLYGISGTFGKRFGFSRLEQIKASFRHRLMTRVI